MNDILKQLTDNNLNDYKITLVPHVDLAEKIAAARTAFNEKFKPEFPIRSHAELTLVTWKQSVFSEKRILSKLKVLALGFPPFKVEIRDFGSAPSHSIYLNVTSKVPLELLSKKIRQETQGLMKVDGDIKPHFLNEFHITLARKLKPWQYEEGWLEYSHKHFTAKFIADRILVSKKAHGEKYYKPIDSFNFENLPIETTQGELF
jgi:2'-5' RNA ligase